MTRAPEGGFIVTSLSSASRPAYQAVVWLCRLSNQFTRYESSEPSVRRRRSSERCSSSDGNDLSTPTGTRTPVPWLRTKYPRPLDDGGSAIMLSYDRGQVSLFRARRGKSTYRLRLNVPQF